MKTVVGGVARVRVVGNSRQQCQTSQLSLIHSETQGFWSILKVIPSISL